MRHYLFLLFLFASFQSYAQFSDDFSDFDLSANPTWTGDVSKFITNSDTMLQSNGNNATADTLILTTASSIADSAEWNFLMQLEFNPTETGNYVKVYLMSDNSNLDQALNGYFLRIGETGNSDTLELWRQDGLIETKVLTGTSSFGSSLNARIRVTRKVGGIWTLFADPNGGQQFQLEGTATDNSHTSTQHFGLYCKYSTASRFDQYLFDDFFVGNIIGDTTKPFVTALSVLNNMQLQLSFNESIDTVTGLNVNNYNVDNGIGNPASVQFTNSSTLQLNFTNSFIDGVPSNLSINNVEDINGNPIIPTTEPFIYNLISVSQPFDVVITEIMADANPPVNLPLAEYIEIHNRSGKTFNLAGWSFTDGNTTGIFPSYIFTDGSYLIICDDSNENLFTPFGDVLGLATFPTLNDDGDNLELKNGSFIVLDRVNYQRTWYRNDLKDDGGFSLEKIDVDYPCSNALNWKASESFDGGTPGIENSVDGTFIDNTSPVVLYTSIINSSEFLIVFNEPMDLGNLLSLSSYTLDNSIGSPISVTQTNNNNSEIKLTFSTVFQAGVTYQLAINSTLTDCSGNEIDLNSEIFVSIAEQLMPNTLIINEVLFNPKDDEIDFVEIYNPTSKTIDLSSLWLANANIQTGLLETSLRVTTKSIPIFPDEYVALSKDGATLISKYPTSNPNRFINMVTLPSYNNAEGIVVLADINGDRIDEFHYYEDWHYPLLNDINGVSLERINANGITQDENNWHSAAESVGYATPAYKNSQQSIQEFNFEEIKIEPESFSPDNDGSNDVLNIIYQFAQNNLNASVTIYDKRGREIKKLVRNQLIGNKGTWNWDGITEDNEKAIIGIYIAYIEVFGADGFNENYKKTFVLAGRL